MNMPLFILKFHFLLLKFIYSFRPQQLASTMPLLPGRESARLHTAQSRVAFPDGIIKEVSPQAGPKTLV